LPTIDYSGVEPLVQVNGGNINTLAKLEYVEQAIVGNVNLVCRAGKVMVFCCI
jgi:hypothetical protein